MSEVQKKNSYGDDAIIQLTPRDHVRLRTSMYVGTPGDGSERDDALYVLVKEVIDNGIDEFIMGYGKSIEITLAENRVSVRDYGRGIPLNSLDSVVSQINTGAKYDQGEDSAFDKTVGLNGVGVKAVNYLSSEFVVRSVRDGEARKVVFGQGYLLSDERESGVNEKNGTFVSFVPDPEIFPNYQFNVEYIEQMVHNYAYLNVGLTLNFNGVAYSSKNGLLDLVNDSMENQTMLYPPIHLSGKNIEIAMTHSTGYGETYYTFANSQNTWQGGTHQAAFRETVVKVLKDFYRKDYDPSDVRTAIVAAVSVRVSNAVFENQVKSKLGSKDAMEGVSMRQFIGDFLAVELDNYLHRNPEVAQLIQRKIIESEKERKAMAGVQKKSREANKRLLLNNKNLRDCKIHRGDKSELASQTMIFITEGNSASGSITKSRNALTQAVFSLRGKPLNTYGKKKAQAYANEEFKFLHNALNIDDDIENLRYEKVVIATDADVDGMHIRMLLLTFFLQYFPDLIRDGHLFIMQTPLFRVRNKKETYYCYSEQERLNAVERCGAKAEITRFKGLGEISPDEFAGFIGEQIRLDKVRLTKDDPVNDLLTFYMGTNTYDRQMFIRENLRFEEDLIEEHLMIGGDDEEELE
ncbi:MAG: ATP-binding protein [Alistipes sp.]|nr:ATP-binding protein [Alistipes sp.]